MIRRIVSSRNRFLSRKPICRKGQGLFDLASMYQAWPYDKLMMLFGNRDGKDEAS
jgi:hypothetical protein